jgi:SAM-dependent methyltransferase
MMTSNIKYTSPEIERFFNKNRIKWNDFYNSEKQIFSQLCLNKSTSILDIGCACGGLGLALNERFGVKNYTGIEICTDAAKKARILNPQARIIDGDVLNLSNQLLGNYDIVTSLSCIDWNIEFSAMLQKAWSLVKVGGEMVLSLRLTEKQGIDDINISSQFINFEGKKEGEVAPYVVLNYHEWINTAKTLPNISVIRGYGYYGSPSITAVTPFKKVCFAVFALQKYNNLHDSEIVIDLNIPQAIHSSLN